MTDFIAFPKIYRYSRDCVVTEKIDGTNGSIYISNEGVFLVGSRTQWITPEKDNHGFAKWAHENKDELLELGPGWHFGEWWGYKINRGYGIKERVFSLFNLKKWGDPYTRPACCSVVPTLWTGDFPPPVHEILSELLSNGSMAAPGFMKPEGIVIHHIAGNFLLKKTFGKDGVEPKINTL
ncbi:MAG: RNA ligase family protein [bacterium]|nr:RNA ligase family protein [bacterium]